MTVLICIKAVNPTRATLYLRKCTSGVYEFKTPNRTTPITIA
jgi:hypothetical protein